MFHAHREPPPTYEARLVCGPLMVESCPGLHQQLQMRFVGRCLACLPRLVIELMMLDPADQILVGVTGREFSRAAADQVGLVCTIALAQPCLIQVSRGR